MRAFAARWPYWSVAAFVGLVSCTPGPNPADWFTAVGDCVQVDAEDELDPPLEAPFFCGSISGPCLASVPEPGLLVQIGANEFEVRYLGDEGDLGKTSREDCSSGIEVFASEPHRAATAQIIFLGEALQRG